jgi:hypothetical protein
MTKGQLECFDMRTKKHIVMLCVIQSFNIFGWYKITAAHVKSSEHNNSKVSVQHSWTFPKEMLQKLYRQILFCCKLTNLGT